MIGKEVIIGSGNEGFGCAAFAAVWLTIMLVANAAICIIALWKGCH